MNDTRKLQPHEDPSDPEGEPWRCPHCGGDNLRFIQACLELYKVDANRRSICGATPEFEAHEDPKPAMFCVTCGNDWELDTEYAADLFFE